jgi:uncharacterized membrane protein
VLLMNRMVRYFVNGLLLSTPIALTLYVCWRIFRAVDSWLGLPWYGAGFVATLVLITLVGWLATTFLWNSIFGLVEHAMERVPLVRFLYNSLKEVLGAFVGEKKRFDRPVVVKLMPGGNARALGFLTRESLDSLGLRDLVAVYLPQSYNCRTALFPDQAPRSAREQRRDGLIVSGSGGRSDRGAKDQPPQRGEQEGCGGAERHPARRPW